MPAYFTERQKQATKNAGEIAGLEVIKNHLIKFLFYKYKKGEILKKYSRKKQYIYGKKKLYKMEKYEDFPIGIDLGTTFSCIGVYRNAAVEIIPNEKGDRTTPSIVSFLDDDIYVGEHTEYKRLKDPKNKIYAVKRIIGRNFDDKEVQEDISKFSYKVRNDNNRPQIEVNSNGIKKYSPEEISAKILAKLKQSAESFLQQKIKKVVITVPAYFTERQKQATKMQVK